MARADAAPPPLRGPGLRARMAIAAALLATLVGILFVLDFVAVRDERAAAVSARRSRDVIAQADLVEREVVDLETGIRGYELTGDHRFLQPWRQAERRLPDTSRALVRLVADEPAQRARVAALVARVRAYRATYARRAVRAAGRGTAARARVLALALAGKRRVDEIRRVFDRFSAAERRLATSGSADATAAGRRSLDLAVGGVVVAAALGAAFWLYVARTVVRPLREAAAGVSRIAGGDLASRLPVRGSGEAAELATAVNVMAERLEEGRAALEGERDRVRALYGFGRSIAAVTEPAPLAQTVATAMATLTAADAVEVTLAGEHVPLAAIGRPRRGARPVAIPLVHGSQELGTVTLHRAAPLDPSEREVVSHLGESAAVALRTVLALGAARHSASVTRAVLNTVSEGIRLIGPDGETLLANEGIRVLAPHLFGPDTPEPGPDDYHRLAERTTDPGALRGFLERLESDRDAVVATEFTLLDSRRSFVATVSPVYDESGMCLGRLIVAREVTAEREAARAKDEFVANVSHELRTPLSSILGYLEVIRSEEIGPLSDVQREFLGVVERNGQRLLALVSDLLLVARAEAGALPIEHDLVDAAKVAADSVAGATPEAERRGVRLTLEGERAVPVRGDATRLGQVIDNLLSNALKFTPAGGAVAVAARREGERGVVEVSDTGIGIARAEQQRLFERLFRTTAATALAIPGTGLGLVISRQIAEAHGGRLTFRSEEGRGSSFRLELPLAARSAGEAAA